jgi:hypothetical protein
MEFARESVVSNFNVQACLNIHTSGAQWYCPTIARSRESARDAETREIGARKMEGVLPSALGAMNIGEGNDISILDK